MSTRTLAAAGTVLLCACQRETPLTKGGQFFAVLDEAVLEVSFRTPERRVEAQRFAVSQPFAFSFADASSGSFEHCSSTAGLQRALEAALDIRVADVLSSERASALLRKYRASQWTELEIRDVVEDGDPFRLRLLTKGAPPGRAYARSTQSNEVFVVDRGLLQLMGMGCGAR